MYILHECAESILGLPYGSAVKNPPAIQKTEVWSLGWEDPLEEDMATHSTILAWEIPWKEEPTQLQSKMSQPDVTEHNTREVHRSVITLSSFLLSPRLQCDFFSCLLGHPKINLSQTRITSFSPQLSSVFVNFS